MMICEFVDNVLPRRSSVAFCYDVHGTACGPKFRIRHTALPLKTCTASESAASLDAVNLLRDVDGIFRFRNKAALPRVGIFSFSISEIADWNQKRSVALMHIVPGGQ